MAPNCPVAAAARASNAANERKADGLLQASASNAAIFGSTAAAFKRITFLQLLTMKLLWPAPQLWPNVRLKTLQPSTLAAAEQNPPRNFASARRPQLSAVKLWAQPAAVTFKLQRSAMKSLQPWPQLSPALARGKIATASRRPPHLRKPQAPAPPYEAA